MRVNVEQDGCSIVQKEEQLNPHKLRMKDLQLNDFPNTRIKSQSPKKVESSPYIFLGYDNRYGGESHSYDKSESIEEGVIGNSIETNV
jgi:hypothetical protein